TSVVQTRKEEECKTPAASLQDFGMNNYWNDHDYERLMPSTSTASMKCDVDPANFSTDVIQYKCNHCSAMFVSHRKLNLHIRMAHYKRAPTMKMTKIKRKTCPNCGKVFPNLRAHACCPEDAKTYPCTVCDHRFPTKHALIVHLKDIHGRKEFMCNKCGADFQLKRDLADHEKTHVTTEALVNPNLQSQNTNSRTPVPKKEFPLLNV
ncbi:hypothetical protein PFISCL1PPCAC_905, partial [Pristionchus fissidentatus]